uniref:VASt domain-containing protein n=1 Tax=Ascaris lumbricoides TaxID=6252 RepID=A0A0M3HUU0_ASCLU
NFYECFKTSESLVFNNKRAAVEISVNSEFVQPTLAWYRRSVNGSSLQSNTLDVVLRSELPERDDNNALSESVGEESSSTSLNTLSQIALSTSWLSSLAAATDSPSVTSFPHEGIENQVTFLNDGNEWANVFAGLQHSAFSVPNFLKVVAAFKRENIALNGAHRITVVYEANSTLLEEFGDFFGFDGARYHAENGVVEVKMTSNFAISNIFWRRIANDVLLYLNEHKKTRFHDIIAVIF